MSHVKVLPEGCSRWDFASQDFILIVSDLLWSAVTGSSTGGISHALLPACGLLDAAPGLSTSISRGSRRVPSPATRARHIQGSPGEAFCGWLTNLLITLDDVFAEPPVVDKF